MSWQSIRGWLAVEEAALLREMCAGKIVLEIGSYCGKSTVVIAEVAKRVFALDWHRGDADTMRATGVEENTLDEFLANTHAYKNVVPLIGEREKAFAELQSGSMDVVYVDGAHDTKNVESDLRLALHVLRDGGTILMHDWNRPSVRQGFMNTFGPNIPKSVHLAKSAGTMVAFNGTRPKIPNRGHSMTVNTNAAEMMNIIACQAIKNAQVEAENNQLRAEIEKLTAELDEEKQKSETLDFAREQNEQHAKRLADELAAKRNGEIPVAAQPVS